MKKSDVLKALMGKKFLNGGKKTFTRPEGWEKTIKRSHFDSDKSFDGESFGSIKAKKDDESGVKQKQDMLDKLSDYFKKKK